MKKWEQTHFKLVNEKWVRGGYVEGFFNKQVFSYDKKGRLIEKKNYDKNDKLIGVASFDYKRKLLKKRTYRRNPRHEKKLLETLFSYNKNNERISEVQYWNGITRRDSLSRKRVGDKWIETKYDSINFLKGYKVSKIENGRKIREQEFSKDSIPIGSVTWERSSNGKPISKKIVNSYEDGNYVFTYIHSYNQKGQLTKMTKNGILVKRFEIKENTNGHWTEILVFNKDNLLMEKTINKIEYY
ncbi:MAG: hypothetical protein AAFZ89_12010 [Bacteroidota bacterium]